MLTTSDHFFVPSMFVSGFQEDLLHQVLGGQGVIHSLCFLLALLEDRSDIKSFINCMGKEKRESSFSYMFSVTQD